MSEVLSRRRRRVRPLRDDAPERSSERLRYSWTSACGAAPAAPRTPLRPTVELDAEADEVDRARGAPGVADRVGRALDLDRAGDGEPAEAELLEERQEEALAGRRRERVASSVAPTRAASSAAHDADEPVPAARDRLAEALARREPVVGVREARDVRVDRRDLREEVGRQEAALGADRTC